MASDPGFQASAPRGVFGRVFQRRAAKKQANRAHCKPLGPVCLALFLAILPVSPLGATDSSGPARCVADIGRSLDNADAAAFSGLVDVDGLLSQAMDVFLAQAASGGLALPPMLALMLSGAAGPSGEGVRGLLRGEAKSFLLSGVSSGVFGGAKPSVQGGSGLLAPLFAGASLGRKVLRNPGPARRDGDDYIMPFDLADEGNGEIYRLLGRFSPSENGLRLTGIDNLAEIMKRLGREGADVNTLQPDVQ